MTAADRQPTGGTDDAAAQLELARLAVKGLLERVSELNSSVDEARRAVEASSAQMVRRLEQSAEPLVAALRERAESLGAEVDLVASGLAARSSGDAAPAVEQPEPAPSAGAEPAPAAEPDPAPTADAEPGPAPEAEPAPDPDGEPGTGLSSDDLDAAGDQLDGAPTQPEAEGSDPGAGGRAGSERARLLALNLALGGASREETERELSGDLDAGDLGEILDEAYGEPR